MALMKNASSLSLLAACVLFLGAVDALAQGNPAEPYQRSVNTSVWTNSGTGTTSFVNFSGNWSIPAGKMLVVEHVSVRVRANPGERISVSVTCQGTPAGLSAHRLVLSSQGTFDGFEHLVGTTPLRCYTTGLLLVNVQRNSQKPLTLAANTEFSVTGFLADVP
jgi:hypothetical protein